MTQASGLSELAHLLLSSKPSAEFIQSHVQQIHQGLLARSRYVREANFTAIHPEDLKFLFGAYDEQFLNRRCQAALDGQRLTFRLAPRMTRAGGKTTRVTRSSGEVSFEIAVASSILFDGFGKLDRSVTVCGMHCDDRLQALQRIFEHELVHLAELVCWNDSDCAAARFQDIARRLFLHRAHTHQLVTRRERAAESGIRIGSRVVFLFEGRTLAGRVNRITKRATVLVEDPDGQKYSDGMRYKTYYVPISFLKLLPASAAEAQLS
jgi:hypothetical protein